MADTDPTDTDSSTERTTSSRIRRRSVLKGTAALGLGAFTGVQGIDAAGSDAPMSVDPATASEPVEYADTFVGTARAAAAGEGGGAMPYPNNYPGATRPHGMVQLSPDTGTSNIAGYHHEDDEILGFSHTHVSGTGCFGLGNFLLSPTTEDVTEVKREQRELNVTDELSASFWFRTDKAPGGMTSLLRHDHNITPLQVWSPHNANVVWFSEGMGYQTASFDFEPYADGEWHHYAVTYESGNRVAAYVDGEEVASAEDGDDATVGTLATSELPWSVGGAVDNGGEWFTGDMDEATVYSRVLDECEIRALADGESVSGDVLFSYSFDGVNSPSDGDDVADDSGNGYTGMVYGDPEPTDGASGTALSFDGAGDGVGLSLPQLSSTFSHETESAGPGYYSVRLEEYATKAELTATDRVGVHRYTFDDGSDAGFLLDAGYNLGDSGTKSADVELRDERTIVGSQTVPGPFCSGAEPYSVHFAAKFSKPFDEYGTWNGVETSDGSTSASGPDVGAFVRYGDASEVIVKVGISYVSRENAMDNLETEVPDWDFDRVEADATETWNDRLGRIEVEGDDANKVKFYTALYHAMLGPTIFEDTNGEYLGMDDEVYTADGYHHYQMFSLWDTFRAEHPLLNIVEPKVQEDAIKSLLDMYEHGGWLPKWEFANRYTNVMIADHATSIIGESMVKGLTEGYDTDLAYEAMYKNSTRMPGDDTYYAGRLGLDKYTEYGYIPEDDKGNAGGSVSTTLEGSYNDFAIAQAADLLGKDDDYETFMKRAGFYENVFDPDTKFMRPRLADGSWYSPDDGEWKPTDWGGFTEGNSWSYTWHTLQDIGGLVDLMGEETFVERLDHMFDEFVYPSWNDPFTHYWQGNEPSHHAPYLYPFAGQPWKTQEVVQDVMNSLYTTGPGGVPGNEDVGQMSAWYVMSAMGFYAVTPASGSYVIGSPAFETVTINLPDYHYGGGQFVVDTTGAEYDGDRYRYIQNAHLNGDVHRESWFDHADLEDGGELRLHMGTEKNTDWGVTPKGAVSPPPSMSDD